MKNGKIGRNDPCPCGSGKKYKHCCIGLEGIVSPMESPFDRYNQLVTTVKVKLEQDYTAQIRKLRKPARERFVRLCPEPSLSQEQEPLFSDWLWFDMPDSEGMTFGAEYLQEHVGMEDSLRECLVALNKSTLGLYEVWGMESGKLKLADFLSGKTELVLLKEPLDIEIGENRPLLLGRLLDLPLGRIFSGSVLMLRNDAGQADFVRSHLQYWLSLKDHDTEADTLKQGEITFGLFVRAQNKTGLALNDIRVVRDPHKLAQVQAHLLDSSQWQLVHRTGGITWYDLAEKAGPARMGISEDNAVVYADWLEDIRKIQEAWQAIVSPASWEIVNSALLLQPPPAELENIWYSVIKERETERWLHTVHQELADKSPSEVLQEGNGQEQILTMLDDFAAQAAENQYSLDLLAYMRDRIRSN